MKFNFRIEDIKYVKILCKRKDGSLLTAKAAVKNIGEREISAFMKFEDDFYIEYPQEVTFSIVCNDGLYKTKTKLKSYDNVPPYIIFYLEIPQGIEYQQNREYFRVPVIYECIYHFNESENSKNLNAKTFDISANGVSIVLPELTVSKEDAELDLMIEGRLIHTVVKYIRSECFEDGYKVSFMFTNISNFDRDYISQVCIKKQLEHKRNNVNI